MRNWIENVAAVLFVSLLAGLAIAERTSSKGAMHVPADSKFVIHIDLNAVKQTQLGAMLFKIAKQKALEELGKESGEEAAMQRIKETLGMDPFEDIQSITLSSSDFENAEQSMLAMVRLKKTSGNLEGLALALPEYEATEHVGRQIHSASPQNDKRIYGAIHGDGDQDRIVVLTPSLTTIKAALDQLDDAKIESPGAEKASAASASAALTTSEPPAGKTLASLQVFEIPTEKLGKGPQAVIAKIVTSFNVELSSEGDNLTATAIMTTENEKQAEQLQQMASGFVAMIELAQSMDSNDRELKQIRETLKGVETKITDKRVCVRLRLNADQIAKAISKELGIEINLTGAGESPERALAEARLKERLEKWDRLKAELEKSQRDAEAEVEELKKQLEKIK